MFYHSVINQSRHALYKTPLKNNDNKVTLLKTLGEKLKLPKNIMTSRSS